MNIKGIVLLSAIALALVGSTLGACGSGTSTSTSPAPTDAKGKEAVVLVAGESKRLAAITAQMTNGHTKAAVAGWNKLTQVLPPSSDTYMVMLCSDYQTYAYAVRGYIAGTGTLQTAQDAAGTVNTDLLAMQ